MTAELQTARRAAHALGESLAGTPEVAPLAAALGRVLAAPVRAACPVPPFPASAMDGWVVRGDGPWRLGAPIRVGDPPPTEPLAPGTARPIATGAPVPPGVVAVLRSERGRLDAGLVVPTVASPAPGADVRAAGEECFLGQTVLPAGCTLSPPAIALAAACGTDEVQLAARPAVDLVLTGGEVEHHGVPRPGRVRDVFGPQLPGLLAGTGCTVAGITSVGDDAAGLEGAITAAAAPLLITTGGTGGGPTDRLREVLRRLDCCLLVDGVDMRPGHPTLLARRPDGRAVLGLPGNPFAAFVALIAVGGALIDGLCGRPLAETASERAGEHLPNPGVAGVRIVAVRRGADGIRAVGRQGPAMLTGLLHAHGLAVVPPGGAAPGVDLETLSLPW